jgi:hypothetical protein
MLMVNIDIFKLDQHPNGMGWVDIIEDILYDMITGCIKLYLMRF